MTLPTLDLELPYPPSVNRIWRRAGHRIYLAPAGVAYRKEVADIVERHTVRYGSARLGLDLLAHVPDKRKRDLDNLFKSTLDALQAAGLFEDDSQFDELFIRRAPLKKGGLLVASIYPV
jgi:crossover junction endodeoxyribonuclease RusA